MRIAMKLSYCVNACIPSAQCELAIIAENTRRMNNWSRECEYMAMRC